MLFIWGKQPGVGGPFPAALASFSIIGCIGTAQFAVNQFGYVGAGFRRFLLLPTQPAAAFRAGSYLFITLSAALIPVAALAWCAFSPIPVNAPQLAMLLGCSVTSLFLFHGIALWTSLLAARRGNFNLSFGNDLSFAGNVTVMGSVMIMLFLPAPFGQAQSRRGGSGQVVGDGRRGDCRVPVLPGFDESRGGRIPRPPRTTDGPNGRKRMTAMDPQTDAIRISNLVKRYGTVTAVEDLSLTVRPGPHLWFPGPQRLRQEHHHRLPHRSARPHGR